MPDAGASYETKRFDISYSIITSVVREGPDVVITIRNLWYTGSFIDALRFKATICFVDARRIRSRTAGNPDSECRLEPGWKVERLDFDGIVARLTVCFTGMPEHMVYSVYHQIYCGEVTLERRLDIRQTLMAYFFSKSTALRTHVIEEPPPSPPIEGQE